MFVISRNSLYRGSLYRGPTVFDFQPSFTAMAIQGIKKAGCKLKNSTKPTPFSDIINTDNQIFSLITVRQNTTRHGTNQEDRGLDIERNSGEKK